MKNKDVSFALVTKNKLDEYINCWVEGKELPIQTKLLYCKDGDVFVGVDNTDGNCWVEEFNNREDLLDWLLDSSPEIDEEYII